VRPSPGSAKTTSKISESFCWRLDMYALAASAAGVGILALTQPAEGKIVYTPAHKVIGLNQKIALDLNHDGKNDFSFQERFFTTTSVGENHSIALSVLPTRKANEIWGKGRPASALPAGIRVGPKGQFSYGKKLMAVDYYADGTGGSGTCAGPWNNVKNHYLGLKFKIDGKVHFGWARLNVDCVTTFSNHQVNGLLIGYAYETIPNKPIVTGKKRGPDEAPLQPSTLGRLARGASAK
jgi:hypothetical protein